jgi:anti-sigma regulatory factor (Ser/Thr protein kinase)
VPHNLSVTIANSVDELPQLIRLVKTFLSSLNLASRIEYAVELVLEEIIVNIVKHGYHDQKKHEIVVEVSIQERKIVFTFLDDGRPFNPLSVSPPDPSIGEIEDIDQGGLGMHFVRTMRQSMEYRRSEGKNILKVWLNKDA